MEKKMGRKKQQPRLTKKEKGFADAYIETGNGVQSALQNYNTDSYGTAAVIAHENLSKPKVKAYLESKAERAAEIIFELAESSEVDSVKLNASKDILDRAGFKVAEPEQQKNESGNTYNFVFNAQTQADVREIEDRIKARLIGNDDIQENTKSI